MSLGDRDYMKASSDDERRVADYEAGERQREYGDLGARRRISVIRLALILAALIGLLALLRWLVPGAS